MYLYMYVYIYIYILEVLGWGGHCLFVHISNLPAKEKMVKRITRHLCNSQRVFMSLPAQTASIKLPNMG